MQMRRAPAQPMRPVNLPAGLSDPPSKGAAGRERYHHPAFSATIGTPPLGEFEKLGSCIPIGRPGGALADATPPLSVA
jgi:hypothetical protein